MAQNGINKCIILGRLGQDPEVKYTPQGGAIVNLSVATSESWKDKNTGEKKEKSEWHRVVVFGKLAEIAGQYLKKGSQVYLEGKLQTRKWQDQNGQDRYSTEIVIDGFNGTMQMLGGGNQSQQQPMQQPQMQQPQMQQQPQYNVQPQPQMQQPVQQQQQPVQQQGFAQQVQQAVQNVQQGVDATIDNLPF